MTRIQEIVARTLLAKAIGILKAVQDTIPTDITAQWIADADGFLDSLPDIALTETDRQALRLLEPRDNEARQ